MDGILTPQTPKAYTTGLRRFPFPPGWAWFQSPLHHLASYRLQEHARWSIVIPPLLRIWLQEVNKVSFGTVTPVQLVEVLLPMTPSHIYEYLKEAPYLKEGALLHSHFHSQVRLPLQGSRMFWPQFMMITSLFLISWNLIFMVCLLGSSTQMSWPHHRMCPGTYEQGSGRPIQDVIQRRGSLPQFRHHLGLHWTNFQRPPFRLEGW